MPPLENQSMRDDFNDAIQAIEKDDEGAITTETEADAAEITAEDLNSHEESEEAEAETKVEAQAEEILGQESESAGDTDSDAIKAEGKSTGLANAPASWSPAAREGWAEVPETMRAQINKRETEINKALNDGAENRKAGERFNNIAGQYAQVIAAEGAPDAVTGFSELMKTVATLRMGSAEQKAHKIADFIQHYGIDIDTLDGILSSNISGQPATPNIDPGLQQMLDQRLAPVNDLLARMDENTRQQNFQSNQNAINEVATFKQNHEFYADVQDAMADMVDLAAARGVNMNLQDAYDKACAINPEISGIITKRVSDASLINGKQSIDAKKAAASSVMGRQGGAAPRDGQGMSMHDTLSEAWDAQTG